MIALLLTLVMWTHPAPTLYICMPGTTPTVPSNCERIRYARLGLFPSKLP